MQTSPIGWRPSAFSGFGRRDVSRLDRLDPLGYVGLLALPAAAVPSTEEDRAIAAIRAWVSQYNSDEPIFYQDPAPLLQDLGFSRKLGGRASVYHAFFREMRDLLERESQRRGLPAPRPAFDVGRLVQDPIDPKDYEGLRDRIQAWGKQVGIPLTVKNGVGSMRGTIQVTLRGTGWGRTEPEKADLQRVARMLIEEGLAWHHDDPILPALQVEAIAPLHSLRGYFILMRSLRPLRLASAKPNPAKARRWDGNTAQYVPVALTPGHADLAETQEARRLAQIALDHPSVSLGKGNFGVTYLSEGRVVKLPRRENMHGMAWPPAALRQEFIHEAGIANELRALGHTVVPKTVFIEGLTGAGPFDFALVREYGHPVDSLALAEWDELSRVLSAVQDEGYATRDELLILRRSDGSLFVGDVGLWKAPAIGASGPVDSMEDDLGTLLSAIFWKINGKAPGVSSWHDLRRRRGQSLMRNKTWLGDRARAEVAKMEEARRAVGLPV